MRNKFAITTASACLVALTLAAFAGGCSRISLPAILHPRQSQTQPSALTLPLSSVVAAPPSGLYIGIYRPPAPFNRTPLDTYAKISPKRLAIVMWYQQWGEHGPNIFDPAMCIAVYQHGAVPMISWEPWDPGGNPHRLADPSVSPTWTLAAIVNGSRDHYLRTWARQIKSLGGPVMLRPLHEMDGNWYATDDPPMEGWLCPALFHYFDKAPPDAGPCFFGLSPVAQIQHAAFRGGARSRRLGP